MRKNVIGTKTMYHVGYIPVNGDIHRIYRIPYSYCADTYSIDLGILGEDLTEMRYFPCLDDALWYFDKLLKHPTRYADTYRRTLVPNDLGDTYERIVKAREMFNEIMLFAEHDGNDLTNDLDIELGYYKMGTPMTNIMDDFEMRTGVTTDYMYGYEDEPFAMEQKGKDTMAWKYVNVKVPMATATMETDDDIRELLHIFGIDADGWFEASTGCSANGSWGEGDVWDLDGNELLSYDFMEVNGEARIFRYWKAVA